MLSQALAADPRTAETMSHSPEDVRRGFVSCFEEVNRRLHKAPKLCASSGGTTMTAVIICGKMVWSAWAGDSRACIAKSKGDHAMT